MESPYRSLVQPILDYLDKIHESKRYDWVTLIVPEPYSHGSISALIKDTAAIQIKWAMLSRDDVVVTNLRYLVELDP